MLIAQPSAARMTVEGKQIRKYSPQLLKALLLGHDKAYLISLVQIAKIAVMQNILQYVIMVARPSPFTPMLQHTMKR